MSNISTLTLEEVDEVSGGIVPLIVVAVSFFVTSCAAGYMIGKDAAQRDNRVVC